MLFMHPDSYIEIRHLTFSFMIQDNKDLYAEEAAAQREKERQRMLSIPGLIAPNEIQDEMVDSWAMAHFWAKASLDF